jgi:steroid Delta-isomerase
MPTPQDIEHFYDRYTAALSSHDIDAVAALFAVDAVVFDPVDSPALEGIDKIRQFFIGTSPAVRSLKISGPVHISNDCRHAAVQMEAEIDLGDGLQVMEVLDAMTFDDEGRVITMRAYYGPTNLRSR